jgi:hypothetical protein
MTDASRTRWRLVLLLSAGVLIAAALAFALPDPWMAAVALLGLTLGVELATLHELRRTRRAHEIVLDELERLRPYVDAEMTAPPPGTETIQ